MVSGKIIKDVGYYFKLSHPHAGEYYFQEKVKSFWIGALVEQEGLAYQEVSKEQISDFLSRKRKRKGAVVGVDLCFSAPKDVSVLLLIDKRVKKAHRKAVIKANQYILQNFVKTRITQNKQIYQVNGETAVACFEHLTSRSLDINLHTHCLYLNVVYVNGKYYSLDARDLLSQRYEFDKVYKQALVQES